ncbi:putative solute carrier family 13 [Helianthus annuus]|nr:putative solute carrier family 13 [Helianthus annuus]KAJ0595386.1 putative solute carrier family 13 [Helianthus annuus]KAJ0756057.1 putative solute carrier family 13 [Helianthus annuus]KAJ0759847.1 putative solute carrier family 13 [Helianthus annuus]
MLNVDAVTTVVLGLSVLLITGVVTWKECLAEAIAWDTLTSHCLTFNCNPLPSSLDFCKTASAYTSYCSVTLTSK